MSRDRGGDIHIDGDGRTRMTAKRKRAEPLPFNVSRVAAPLVGCSDLAWRLLCRKHGATLAFTEMIFADRFIADAAYRERKFQTLPADRPLILQLAGNDPDTLAAAVKLAATLGVDGVDLNVGCPLPQARDSCFGAYLLDREKWPLLERCVAAMRAAAEPAGLVCSCKIRLLETAEATAELARRLEAAGADFLSVHGRQRPSPDRHRTHRQDAADLDAIGVVAAAVSIPVVANGNTEYPADVMANMATTGCAGVMAGEGLLRDPLLFSPEARERADGPSRGALLAAALEYIDLAERHPPESAVLRSHVLWWLGRSGKAHRATFAHCGPYTPAQLGMAIQDAAAPEEFRAILRACLD